MKALLLVSLIAFTGCKESKKAAPTATPAEPAAAPKPVETAAAPDRTTALRDACAAGGQDACLEIARIGSELADHVTHSADDMRKGLALLELACEQATEKGAYCERASLAYATGEKIGKDAAKAKALHEAACKQGLLQGCPCTSTDQCGTNEGLICEKGTCVTAEVQ